LSVPYIRGTPYYSMKTRCSYGDLQPHGEQHPTPPRGRLKGHHVARKNGISRNAISWTGPPVRTTRTLDYDPELPSKHVGSLGWGPDPSE
jgi:hypothetical protein